MEERARCVFIEENTREQNTGGHGSRRPGGGDVAGRHGTAKK